MNNDKYSFFLCLAILTEIAATTLLALSKGMSQALPATTALCCYACSYYFLTRSLKKIPLGLAYALWAGVGIVATSTINFFLFNITLSPGAIAGVLMIASGVLVINLLSGKKDSAATTGS